MDFSMISRLIILLLLIILSAIFSGAETALSSLNIIKIKQLKNKNVKEAVVLEKLLHNSSKTLSTILVGNNIVNIAATAIATEVALMFYTGQKATIIVTTVMTLLILVFGEITPKTYSNYNADKVAVKVSKPLNILSILFTPLLVVLNRITRLIIRVLGGSLSNNKATISEDEIKTIVDVGEEFGIIEKQEREMINSIFEIGDITVTEVMVPRIDMIYLDNKASVHEAMKKVMDCGFSRIPVIDGSIDNVMGILYAKDLLSYYFKNEDLTTAKIDKLPRPAYFVPESKKAIDLLTEMQLEKTHIAIVLDEYGGTLGLITIEDILEEIVGDILDEYDDDIDLIDYSDESTLIVNSKIAIEEINELLNLDLPEDEFESIGGFIFNLIGRIPIQGDIVEYKNILFEILEVNNRRIKKIKITKTD